MRPRGTVKRRSEATGKRAPARRAANSVGAKADRAKAARAKANGAGAVAGAKSAGKPRGVQDLDERRKALADLMHSQVLGQGDVGRAFAQITETATHVLDVDRASVWRLIDGGTAIECVDLYERPHKRHSAGVRIDAVGVPRYFEALQHERTILAHDARTDPRTSEFRASYLEPLGIKSMLDAPVFLRGRMVGVVCHEHTGRRRRWQLHEELLAGSFADLVAVVMETAAWHEAKDALSQERDALETKVAERTRDLQQSEANLRELVDFSPVAMVLTRISDSTVLLANRKAAAMFDVSLQDIQGRLAPQHWGDLTERNKYLEHIFRHGRIDDFEAEMIKGTGQRFWASLSGQRMRYGGHDALLAAIVDMTSNKQTRDDLLEQATHDVLTGVFNRRHVEGVLRKEVDRAERHGRPLTVAMLDADHFKRINDGYGHQAGDDVLRAISERCRNTLRTNDVIGRYGGEEFVIVFPETTLDEASAIAERLRAVVAEQPIRVGEHALEVTVSIGLAAHAPGQDVDKLFRRADVAVYAAKQEGRNRVRPDTDIAA